MSTVRPIMTYTLETRVQTSKATQMLEANEMKVLRKIVDKTKILLNIIFLHRWKDFS